MADRHPPRNTITMNLPSEILFFHILPRVPLKALPNVMCVCKKWHSFLKSSVFAKTCHDHITTDDDDHDQNHHKYPVLSTTKPYHFRSIDCKSPKDSLKDVRRLPLKTPYNDNCSPGNMSILTSLHGLLCVGTSKGEHSQEYSDLILWNPLTGDYKTCRNLKTAVIIKNVTSPLKVESTENLEFQQRASYWTSLRCYWENPSHILLNEKLYFLMQLDRRRTFIQSYSIIRFDTKTENFTEVAVPSFGNQMTDCLGFMVLRGCIHFCVAILIEKETNNENQCCYEMIELWRMDGDGDGDWTKVLSYGPMSFFIWKRSLLHVMGNGNLLIQQNGDVYLLDIKKHTKEMVFTCKSINYQLSPTGKYIETISPVGKYIETTLSPHLYVHKWMMKKKGLEWRTNSSRWTYEVYQAMIDNYEEDQRWIQRELSGGTCPQ
ncbi:unnamed protein product [Lactuca virosa]|uniref:F-box domain-containing protein n=1 Tax=Lactuca virosa TaxID=75947 RepID=A0AAU9LW53_9ASTR|nr:unnamed protein product [Lactuca virosa]